MADNPYYVLGVSENASDDEIKETYRRLARKYQSGSYAHGPLYGVASRKMQELDTAYDAIMQQRREFATEFDSTASEYRSSTNFAEVRAAVIDGRLDDAEQLLGETDTELRTAEWNFLMGTVANRRGRFSDARYYYENACRMDPDNFEYRQAYSAMNDRREGGYRKTNAGSGNRDCSACDICSGLLCADCCCECGGGDCIPCC